MSFSDLFDSEFKNRNKGHFSAIARVAFADGFISEEEKQFLNKLAVNLEISESEYAEILENPLKYPINPPYLHEQRMERLFDLGRMVHVDHHLGDAQDIMIKKFGVALGFNPKNVNAIVAQAMELIDNKVDLDSFVEAMKHSDKQ
jgi:uncharacterized tellurite resistance protein B-like protein